MKCPLCGYEAKAGEETICSRCPLGAGCNMLCCPNCGYRTLTPRRIRLRNRLLRRLRRGWRGGGVRPLSACPLGQQVRVVAIASNDAARLERLSALGLVPGSTIVLKQRHPAYVVKVGGTELALDRELADCIHVGLELP